MALHERILELALQRSFFFPSNEPYPAISGFYDYGPVGKLLKNKIENLWRQRFLREYGFHEIEASIVTPEIILKASGHVDSFSDPAVQCQSCKSVLRADHLVEEKEPAYKYAGKTGELDAKIAHYKIACPSCKKGTFGNAFVSGLMFSTGIGASQEKSYCRPETAQGTFTSFLRLFRNHGTKLPLAAAQIGKSFRNEISPRKGLVRMREFTQMELEYFFNPTQSSIDGFDLLANTPLVFSIKGHQKIMTAKEAIAQGVSPNEIFSLFLVLQSRFYDECGIPKDKRVLRVLDKSELPHYSKGNIDMEVETSLGSIETIGTAYRTNWDLSQHAIFSKTSMEVYVEEEKKKVIPHVVEAAFGVDRLFYSILEHCYRPADSTPQPASKTQDPKPETINGSGNSERISRAGAQESTESGKAWEWFDFPPLIAPYPVAVFPLMKKDGLAEKAQSIAAMLRTRFDCFYQESGSIGKRYARADEIGVPYSITVDYDSLKDDSVTIRYRNDGKQERIPVSSLLQRISIDQANNRCTL